MSSSDQRELERALGVPVTACPRAGEFHNLHYRADGIFIKVLDNPECHRHAVQAAPLAEELVPRTPRLLGHGDLGPDRWWLSYEWVDLAQFEPAPAAVEMRGRCSATCTGRQRAWDWTIGWTAWTCVPRSTIGCPCWTGSTARPPTGSGRCATGSTASS
ncbi:hypothetical protein ACFPZ0_28060 [Streptomonospora nanhaiensis]|uniref:hypothetical protein n=1 Tax=Streptomonospora nanhaiensis TaxID=1323731 RepID=UPI00361F8F52